MAEKTPGGLPVVGSKAGGLVRRIIVPPAKWAVRIGAPAWGAWELEQQVVSHSSHGRILDWVLGALLLYIVGQAIHIFRLTRDQREQGGTALPSPAPSFSVETGNGEPWDDPALAPKPPRPKVKTNWDVHVEQMEPILHGPGSAQWMMKPAPGQDIPPPPPPPPAIGYSKKFRVTNTGGKATGCRARMTGLPSHVEIRWDRRKPGQFINLAHGKHEFAVLDARCFPRVGIYPIAIEVYAENLDGPLVQRFSLDVQAGGFPRLVADEDSGDGPS